MIIGTPVQQMPVKQNM